jgi:hypothetical protein
MRAASVLSVLALLLAFSAVAHEQPLDSKGCHANVAHGSYHCHVGPLAGREFRSQEAVTRAQIDEERRLNQKVRFQPDVPTPR